MEATVSALSVILVNLVFVKLILSGIERSKKPEERLTLE